MQVAGAPAADTDAEQAQFEADKRAVYKHPLFPLLALLLERCEQATAGVGAGSSGGAGGDALGADLQAFAQHHRRPIVLDLTSEVDELMVKSIQVLRIHLLELEKVQELCRDFCGRYIACLKTKMQSENLLRTDYSSGGVESNNNLSGSMEDHSSSNSPQYQSPPALPPPSYPPPPFASNTEVTFPPRSELSPLVVQGSTPLSQIGANLLPTDSFTGTNSNTSFSSHSISPGPDEDSLEEEGSKRGVLPRHATQVMRAWLFHHLVHPYPTEEEKRTLAAQTRLTLLQVNNWFINARRRILQPMLDCSDKPGGKKSKNGGSISKRYWPDALSNPQFTAGLLSSSEDEDQDGTASNDEQDDPAEDHTNFTPLQQPM